jgi:ABC-type nickel/cobalt efflux system permease component RcnA
LRITEREREKERERERERERSGVSPDYDSRSTLTRTTKPSAAVRPSAAEKGASGVTPDYTTQHAHAHSKPSAVEKGHSSDCNATKHATKQQRKRLQTVTEGLVLN